MKPSDNQEGERDQTTDGHPAVIYAPVAGIPAGLRRTGRRVVVTAGHRSEQPARRRHAAGRRPMEHRIRSLRADRRRFGPVLAPGEIGHRHLVHSEQTQRDQNEAGPQQQPLSEPIPRRPRHHGLNLASGNAVPQGGMTPISDQSLTRDDWTQPMSTRHFPLARYPRRCAGIGPGIRARAVTRRMRLGPHEHPVVPERVTRARTRGSAEDAEQLAALLW